MMRVLFKRKQLLLACFCALMLLVVAFVFLNIKPKPAPSIPMSLIQAGRYYVGTVHGDHDYAQHTNVYINAFQMMQNEVSSSLYHQVRSWAIEHGYSDNFLDVESESSDMPVQGVDWWDA